MATITLSANEVVEVYGINSNTGYTIESKHQIFKTEVAKIRSLLAAFRDLEFSQKDQAVREQKFHAYVSYLPEEERKTNAEYSHYISWKNRHEANGQKLELMKREYGVIRILPV